VNSLICCDWEREGCNIRSKRQHKLYAAACEEGWQADATSHGTGRVACTNAACRLRGVMDRWVNGSGDRSEGESESCAGLCFGWNLAGQGSLYVGVCDLRAEGL
jgi:hypothetical protein